jgi:hypothetical protein
MKHKILLLPDKRKDLCKVKSGERGETIMFIAVYRPGGVKKPHLVIPFILKMDSLYPGQQIILECPI